MLSTKESIAVAELVIYIPAFVASIFVSYRQGFSRQLGFLYLVLFCALRTAGAVLQIVSQQNPKSIGDAVWAGILSSIGLSPLLLASFGLLKRVQDSIDPKSWRVRLIRVLYLPCIVGLILGIVGGTGLISSDPSKRTSALSLLKASGILFLVAFLLLAVLAAFCVVSWRNLASGETTIYMAILFALPLLAVRLIYSLLIDFDDNSTFSMTDGNVWMQLGMAIIEEMIITIAFIIAGLVAPPASKGMPESQKPLDFGGKQGRFAAADAHAQPWLSNV